MLHIRERRRALIPTIIEGETGVGKTKLLKVYAAIEGASCVNKFDAFSTLKVAMQRYFALPGTNLQSDEMKSFVISKFDELAKHASEGSLLRIARAVLMAVTETRAHDRHALPGLIKALRAALEGAVFWHPFFNPAQLLFNLRSLLGPRDGASSDDAAKRLQALLKQSCKSLGEQLDAEWKEQCRGPAASEWFGMTNEAVLAEAKVYGDLLGTKHFRVVPTAETPVPRAVPEDGGVEESKADAPRHAALPAVNFDSEECLLRWLLAWLLVTPVNTFDTILMHAAYTVNDLTSDLARVRHYAERALRCFPGTDARQTIHNLIAGGDGGGGTFGSDADIALFASELMRAVGGYQAEGVAPPSFVVFLDEVNTTSILGSIRDVLIDKTLGGSALPPNIFWVCATNPYIPMASLDDADPNKAASGEKAFRAYYQVRPVPEAMKQVKWQFGSLSDDAERDFIIAKIRDLFARGAARSSAADGGAGGDTAAAIATSKDALIASYSYDELYFGSARDCSVCKAKGSRDGIQHWKCTNSTCEKSPLLNDPFKKLLRYSNNHTGPGERVADIGDDLEWATVPVVGEPSDVEFIAEVIATAHRFVKHNEGARAGADGARQETWCVRGGWVLVLSSRSQLVQRFLMRVSAHLFICIAAPSASVTSNVCSRR